MDEYFNKQIHTMKITAVELNKAKKMSLIRGFEVERDKKFMRFVALKIGNKIITDELEQVVLFKEELLLFDGIEEENTFFSVSIKVLKNQKIKSMKFKLSNKKNVYFSRAEAKAITTLWNMSLQGYSFARLMEEPTKQTVQSWSKHLLSFGYLNTKEGV